MSPRPRTSPASPFPRRPRPRRRDPDDPAEAAYLRHPAALELPGRPVAGDPVGGPLPSAADPRRPARPVRAICCSGGGIRSAAFSLGGLQRLNAEPDGAGSTWYRESDLLVAVSGGSYIASAHAIVQHGLDPGDAPPYAPGTPEDARLRAHTRYLVDSRTQLSISLLGILYGLVMNLAPVLAAGYLISKALGYLIGPHGLGLLRRRDGDWVRDVPGWLPTSVVATVVAGLGVYVLYRIVDVYRPLDDRVTVAACRVALAIMGLGAAAAVLLLGVPAALVLLEDAHPEAGGIRLRDQTWTLTGTVTALLAIVQQLLRKYGSVKPKGGTPKALGKLAALGKRVVDALLPWLGAVAIVALVVLAMLTWTWNLVVARPGQAQWPGLVITGAVLLVWQALTDVNRTSLHRYYTQRLATAFAVTRSGVELDPPEQGLSRFTTDADKPALVVCATVNTTQPGVVPTGRDCAPFTFSPYRSGISSGTMFQGRTPDPGFDLGHREAGDPATVAWQHAHGLHPEKNRAGLTIPTGSFERRGNHMTLMDMVGVSGAAVSPAMGRMTRPSLRLVMAVANVRLGMWLPNPAHPRWAHGHNHPTGVVGRLLWQFRQPGLRALWREMTGGLTLKSAWVYVTDGGHYENLGLVEALRRGATEILVLDASGDEPFSLAGFAEAVETARADLGVEITIDDPSRLAQAGSSGRAAHLAARCTATYANGVEAVVYLCKAAMVDGLPQDLIAWWREHPDFPRTSTGDQLYGDREFEAYRRLGEAAVDEALGLRAPVTSFSATVDGSALPSIGRRAKAVPKER